MPLLDRQEVLLLKLKTLPASDLRQLASPHRLKTTGTTAQICKRILDSRISERSVDSHIRTSYRGKRHEERENLGITQEVIKRELNKVDSHVWGVVQGELDAHIQTNYVRKYHLFDELVSAVERTLYGSVKSYVLCTWYNYWSTVVIEDLIAEHPNVVPTVKKVKDTDLFWLNQPWDLKITNLPREWFKDGHTISDAIENPVSAAEYLYRLQGAQRFGANNRLFLIIADLQQPEDTWKLKRNFSFLEQSITHFFDKEKGFDEVTFVYNNKPYVAYSKILFVVRN
jgi:hypothetical protein